VRVKNASEKSIDGNRGLIRLKDFALADRWVLGLSFGD
jgi:hypothetical protein